MLYWSHSITFVLQLSLWHSWMFWPFSRRKSNSSLVVANNYGTNGPMELPAAGNMPATGDRGLEDGPDTDKSNNNETNLQQSRSAIYCLHGQNHIEGICQYVFCIILNIITSFRGQRRLGVCYVVIHDTWAKSWRYFNVAGISWKGQRTKDLNLNLKLNLNINDQWLLIRRESCGNCCRMNVQTSVDRKMDIVNAHNYKLDEDNHI